MQDQEFWHSRWAENRIGFHLDDVNPLLPKYWSQVIPTKDQSVLVPLCGKSEDLVWLAGYHTSVTGVELKQYCCLFILCRELYTPMIFLNGQHELYEFDELSIYSGDFFTAPLDTYDLVYDRAASICTAS